MMVLLSLTYSLGKSGLQPAETTNEFKFVWLRMYFSPCLPMRSLIPKKSSDEHSEESEQSLFAEIVKHVCSP